MPFQTGDTGLASAINHYFLFVSFGLVAPLIMGYLLLLRGFGFIGLLWASQGSTLLPPLVNLVPVIAVIIMASLMFSTFDPSLLPSLFVTHIVALASTIVLVLVPTWSLYFSCLSGQIACAGTWDYVVYGVALALSIIVAIALVMTLLAIVDYWRRITTRDSMVAYSAQRYQDLTGSTLVVEDITPSTTVSSTSKIRSSSSASRRRRDYTVKGTRPTPQ